MAPGAEEANQQSVAEMERLSDGRVRIKVQTHSSPEWQFEEPEDCKAESSRCDCEEGCGTTEHQRCTREQQSGLRLFRSPLRCNAALKLAQSCWATEYAAGAGFEDYTDTV